MSSFFRVLSVFGALCAASTFTIFSNVAAGQTRFVPASVGEAAHSSTAAASPTSSILGHKSGRDRVVLLMGALHPFESQFPEIEGRQGFGLHWRGWYIASFVNSYTERAYAAGIERDWYAVREGATALGVGYRIGVVTGYDERLFEVARHTPLLPFAGILAWADVGPVGVDAYYVYRAITLEVSARF